ncbi:hypothetical protein [Candidatus Nitrososphaera sp. FF02]|uniref:hypothetical protein n=1 Tax=Candidatus Nitrososphaera sp. FF02 TaxID=3398226 RepID=UPI0039EB383E
MTEQSTESAYPADDNKPQFRATGTPAEEREEERALKMWNLKQDAKWGKDVDIQKKAIQELARIGAPALGHLREILTVLPPGEIRQSCEDAIRNAAASAKS